MRLRQPLRFAKPIGYRGWAMSPEARRRGPAALVLVLLLFTVVLPASRAPTLSHLRNRALKTMALVLGGSGITPLPGMAVIPPMTQHMSQP
jgi:hypothetical protein